MAGLMPHLETFKKKKQLKTRGHYYLWGDLSRQLLLGVPTDAQSLLCIHIIFPTRQRALLFAFADMEPAACPVSSPAEGEVEEVHRLQAEGTV